MGRLRAAREAALPLRGPTGGVAVVECPRCRVQRFEEEMTHGYCGGCRRKMQLPVRYTYRGTRRWWEQDNRAVILATRLVRERREALRLKNAARMRQVHLATLWTGGMRGDVSAGPGGHR